MPRTSFALAVLLALGPATLAAPPAPHDIPPDIMAIIQKGANATPEERQKYMTWMQSQASHGPPSQALPQSPADDLPDDLKQILAKGSQATPAEKARLVEWMKAKRGNKLPALPGRPGADPGKMLAAFDIASFLPKAVADLDLSKRAAPDQAGYLKIAHDVAAAYLALLPADQQPRLVAAAARLATADKLNDEGARSLMIDGALPAGTYMLARAAELAPRSVLIANNLGALLKSGGDLERALDVFLWADALSPSTPFLEAQRGWVVAYLGDFATAEADFRAALDKEPNQKSALEGMGILAFARGDEQAGAEWMRKSLAHGFSLAAMIGARPRSDEGTGPDARPPAPPIGDDGMLRPGDPDPSVDDSSSSGAGFGDVWQIAVTAPDIPTDPAMMAADIGMWGAWANRSAEEHTRGLQRQKAVHEALAAKLKFAPTRSGDVIHVPRRYTRQLGMLSYYRVIASRRAMKAWKALDEAYLRWNAVNGSVAGTIDCGARASLANEAHAGMLAAWGQAMGEAMAAAREYLAATAKYLPQIPNADVNYAANLDRQEAVRGMLDARRDLLSSWAFVDAGLLTAGVCKAHLPDPGPEPKEDKEHDKKKGDDCHIPKAFSWLVAKTGVVSIDCDGWNISLGEVGKFEVGHKNATGETTVFVGAGVGWESEDWHVGAEGSVGLEYVFGGKQGFDSGFRASAQLTTPIGDIGVTTHLMVGVGPQVDTTNTGIFEGVISE